MDTRARAARLLFIAVLTTSLTATTTSARAVTLGVQLGLNGSGLDGDTPPNSEYINKVGVVAGIQGEIPIGRGLSLGLQPSFVQKKSGILMAPTTRGGSTTELELTFDYFSIPAVVKFAMAGGRTFVSGGLTADFLSSAKLSGAGSDRDVKSAFNGTDLGALLGLGAVFPVRGTRLTTELRLVQGIANMTTGKAAAASGALAPRLHSTGVQLIVGDLFSIGGR